MNKREMWIDVAKGIAMLMVVAVHTSQYSGCAESAVSHWILKIMGLGWLGVQLFFVITAINGFASYKRCNSSYWYWALSRYLRLAPIYLFALLLNWAYAFIANTHDLPYYSFRNICANALLINNIVPYAQNHLVPGGWSISCMFLFLLALPLLANRKPAVLCGISLITVVIAILIHLLISPPGDWEFSYWLILTQLPVFVTGLQYARGGGLMAAYGQVYWFCR